jgi:hypothetical protein
MRRILSALTISLLAGCASGCASDVVNPDPNCQPITDGDCLLPWPSDFYRKDGLVNLPLGVMPKNQVGLPFHTDRFNQLDGWSPATQIVANVKAHVDRTKLPPYADLTRSLDPASQAQLLRFDTGERVPLFAEVDNNALDEEDQVILIHPMVRLAEKTRYVVVLRDLVDGKGEKVRVKPFDLLKGPTPGNARLAALAPKYQEMFDLLGKNGVPKDSLTLAWDFTTGSDAQIRGHLVAMRDRAYDEWEKGKLGYQLDMPTEDPNDPDLLREVLGTYDVPSFLADDTDAAVLSRDDQGNPVYRGTGKAKIVIHIPRCAATAKGPLPFMVFGHGLFGSAIGEMRSGYEKSVINQLCMVQIGTNWIGLSEDDVPTVIAKVLANMENFYILTDRLQQSQVNFLILARLAIRKLKDDPALQVNGQPVSDGKEIYYYGISQGGIEGNTFMALTPDVGRGVLNVGAGNYSLMLTRSADFKQFKGVLDSTYPVQRDQEVMLAALQSYWDFADPISFVGTSIRAPLPDPVTKMPMAPRRLLQQESINDGQVPNVATRLIVRTMGIPLLDPPVQPVYGVDVKPGPLDSAYTQWDTMPMPPPPDNNTPTDEGKGWMGFSAHAAIRRVPELVEQIRRFLKPDGRVEQTCMETCNPG